MATLSKRIEDPAEIADPNVVKVVTNLVRRRNLFFALSDSLFARDGRAAHYKHIGLYVYRRDFLLAYPDLSGRSPRAGRASGATAGA